MRGRSRRRARRAVAIAMGAIAAAGCMPGDLPTPPPVAPGLPSARSETPASAPAAGRAAAPAGRSGSPTADADGIVVDLSQMPDLPCHAMFDTIMGDCSAADIARIRAEILARRSEGGAPPTADSGEDGFLPWDGTLAMAEAQLAAPMTAVTLTGRTPFVLDARPVRWAIGGTTVAGYGYNGMIPGPLLKVRQGATLRVDFSNRIDLPTTVHWHGLRHANASDGVPGVTQPPCPPASAGLTSSRSPTPACSGTTRTCARTSSRTPGSPASSWSSRTTGPSCRLSTARRCWCSTTFASRTGGWSRMASRTPTSPSWGASGTRCSSTAGRTTGWPSTAATSCGSTS